MNHQDKLALDGGTPTSPGPIRPNWPVVTPDMAARVLGQLDALSIYDRSGVVRQFEDTFRSYVGTSYALATSSGTAALHSLYYGARLAPGDEVICCDYGFFATATPLAYLGVCPVFVDCGPNGTISVEQCEAAATDRTRAIVVTHMWGCPGDLKRLRELSDRLGIFLFEDCSHAHGARIGPSVVGSIGHGAAWSLQAKKTVWAGEGGVLATNDDDLYERAMLLGHFNQRAIDEIPISSENHQYAFTGTGLKYRAHPLGLALAVPQIDRLDALIGGRQHGARRLIDALRRVPGVDILSASGGTAIHGYYALVALVDPVVCGFDRTRFVKALHAENVYTVGVPRQMGSMSRHPVFRQGRVVHDGRPLTPGEALPCSSSITAFGVNFFVPSVSPDEVDADLDLTVEAIMKVGSQL